ncbi:MAG: UvrD-helicase domain-containing protein, partial [Myxococcota bacterium]
MATTFYPRPVMLSALEAAGGHAVIEASAGTGKTFTLEHAVVDLIVTGRAEVDQILVVTFTDAATRELRARVRNLIRKVCDEGITRRPAGGEGDWWEIDQAARHRLQEALFRFDGASISTIHGFCQRVLSEQAFLGGRLFEQEHAGGDELFGLAFREEVRTALVQDGEIGEMLHRWLEGGYSLDALQKLLFNCHREGYPDRCKLTPLWDPEGLRRRLDSLPPQDEVLEAAGGVFSGKVASKSLEGIVKHLYEAVSLLREDPSGAEGISCYEKWRKKTRSIERIGGTHLDHLKRIAADPECPAAFRDLPELIEGIEERLASPQVFFAQELLPEVQKRLAARKRALGLLDYDDMLLGVLEALKGESSEVLLEVLRRRWRHALVDEFQDTDQVQWEIFRRIFVDGTTDHRLVVIGDPKQAIYGFRGADVHTYDQAKSHLCRSEPLVLPKNFRSTAALIDSVNQILSFQDDGGSFFTGLNRYESPVSCGDPSRRAEQLGEPVVPVQLLHMHGGGEKLLAASIKSGLACFIAEEIQRLTNEEEGLRTSKEGKTPSVVDLSDIYILTRSRNESLWIGEILRRYGIPHAFYKQDGLFQTDEARDILCLLRAIESPGDLAARMSAWLTPFFGLSLSELPSWKEAGEDHPLTGMLLEWKKLADSQSWARLFDEIVAGSGIVKKLVLIQGERALTNYLHVFELLLADAHSRPSTLGELARRLKARIEGRLAPEGREGDVQRLESDKKAVQLLTMHKAKGLEAEVVFVAGGFTNPRSGGGCVYHRDGARHLHLGKAM